MKMSMKAYTICCVVFCFAALAMGGAKFENSPNVDRAIAEMERANDALKAKAQDIISSALKDPYSVRFTFVRVKNGIACGTFNAKNSFGAYAGEKQFFSDGTGSGTMIEGDKNFMVPWVKKCTDLEAKAKGK